MYQYKLQQQYELLLTINHPISHSCWRPLFFIKLVKVIPFPLAVSGVWEQVYPYRITPGKISSPKVLMGDVAELECFKLPLEMPS